MNTTLLQKTTPNNEVHSIPLFSNRLLAWFDEHGRKELPWQLEKTPYRVWVSEIMLQQTQVATVIPYYERFMARFPTLKELAEANQDEVLAHWSGLGYYARGRNLHKAAQECIRHHQGELPTSLDQLKSLPGIGRSTAGAILSISQGQRVPILDGNVKRVLTRAFGVSGWPSAREVENRLWELASELTPLTRCADYTQAIMDLGATLCTRTRPKCVQCPYLSDCYAFHRDEVNRFPERKPTRKKKTRHAFFLVIQDMDHRICIEKQQENGIWGGLWSLPSLEAEDGQHPLPDPLLEQMVKGKSRGKILSVRYSDPLHHVFSHFNLVLRPLHIHVKTTAVEDSPPANPPAAIRWITKSDMAQTGLPAPITRILERAFKEASQFNLFDDLTPQARC